MIGSNLDTMSAFDFKNGLHVPILERLRWSLNFERGLQYKKKIRYTNRTFSKKDHFFGQKISKILCLAFDFICIYYMSSDY